MNRLVYSLGLNRETECHSHPLCRFYFKSIYGLSYYSYYMAIQNLLFGSNPDRDDQSKSNSMPVPELIIFLAIQMPVCSYHHGYILDSRGHSIGSYVIDSNVYVPNAWYIASCSYLSALFQSKCLTVCLSYSLIPWIINGIVL